MAKAEAGPLLLLFFLCMTSCVNGEIGKASAIRSFSQDLFRELTRDGVKNMVVSPVSLCTALGMLLQGARGETAKQLEHALEMDAKTAMETFSSLMRYLQRFEDVPGTFVAMGNKMFLQKEFNVNPKFTAILKSYFMSTVDTVDFTSKGSRHAINKWASKATRNMIPTLLDKDPDELTVLFLANAVYFKGLWKYQFNKEKTRSGQFHVSSNKRVTVPFMNMTVNILEGEDSRVNAKWIVLPFKDSNIVMVMVLHKERFGAARLLPHIVSFDWFNMIDNSLPNDVTVYIPRFKLESNFELRETLSKLGLADLFARGRTNLTGIATSPPLVVSRVVQKAAIMVDEQGAEAGAATGIETSVYNIKYFRQFVANEPFLVAIVDKEAGVPLFMGLVADPSEVS